MKKIIFLILLFFANRLFADDTAQLQAMINAGNTTLPTHHAPYNITTIYLANSLNANGNIINCTLTSGIAVIMNNPGVKFSHAELVGLDDSVNPAGSTGVQMNADNDTVSHVYIHKFTAYGVLGGDGNLPVITGNKIADIGYAGIFFNSTKHSIQGGIVALDTLDRGMNNPAIKMESDLMLRGTKDYPSTRWQVHDNLMMMPFLPADWDAECFELRHAPNSQIYNNVCIGGSIAISVVGNDFVSTYHNKCSKQKLEGIEYANSSNGMIRDNTTSEQAGMGILIDGFAPEKCRFDTLLNNTISGCKSFGVQLYKDTHDIFIKDCHITASAKAINIQGAYGVILQNCHLTAIDKGATALFLDNSAGKVEMHGGSMTGFRRKFFIYATKPVITDDVLIDGVKSKDVDTDYDKNLTGGSSMGNNIRIK